MTRWRLMAFLVASLGGTALSAAEPEPKRLTLAEAEALVRTGLKPGPDAGINPALPFSLQEWKDEALWTRLRAQVFRVIQNDWPQTTVIARKGHVVPFGVSFGGLGVGSLCVTDLDGDKQLELVFTYAWGSGMHRAQLGIVRFAEAPPKWESLGLTYLHGDLALERVSDQKVKVRQATVRWGANLDKAADGATLVPGPELATIEYDPAARRIAIRPVAGLDAQTRKNLLIAAPKPEAGK